MAKDDTIHPLKKASSLLSGISEYVAAVLAYVLALTGGAQTPYPQTISVLTALATALVLWLLRWPGITKKTELLILPEKSVSRQHGAWVGFLHPFSARTGYAMPFTRRRIEGGLLFSISLAAIVFSGVNAPIVYNEISLLNCYPLFGKPPRILVVKFAHISGGNIAIENQLVTALQQESTFSVCYYQRPANVHSEALGFGKKFNAALIIWGSIDDQILQINFTPRDWIMLKDKIQIERGQMLEFRTGELDAAIPYIGQYLLSQILYMQGDAISARDSLAAYLESLEIGQVEKIGYNNVAEAYFILGLLFDPEVDVSEYPNRTLALQAYTTAIQYNPLLANALLNRGFLYIGQKDYEKAIQDFSAMIDQDLPLKADAYYNRALAETFLNHFQKAIADCNRALEINPTDVGLYHLLGQIYLLSGQFPDAYQAYDSVILYADAEQRQDIISNLEQFIKDNPDLKEEVDKIIQRIRQEIPAR